MTRLVRNVMFTACFAALAMPAMSQDALSKRVSLDLKGMTPGDAFAVLADAIGVKIVVDPAVTSPVDILVKNVTARTALTTMCESIGCRWAQAGGTITVKPAGEFATWVMTKEKGQAGSAAETRASIERITAAFKQTLPAGMKFENAPLETVSSRLSEALGHTIRLTSTDPNITTLTADFGNQTLVSALEGLASAPGKPAVWRIAVTAKDASGRDLKAPTFMVGVKPKARR